MDQPLRVMFICTGNQCRSPFAEHYVRARWSPQVTTASCGIMDLPPTPSPPETVAAAREIGVDLTSHRSRSIQHVELASRDLIVGFEALHVATAAVEFGAPVERCFLLSELPALLVPGDAPAASTKGTLQAAAEMRSRHTGARPAPSVDDPIGSGLHTHRRVLQEIAHHCNEIFERLLDVG